MVTETGIIGFLGLIGMTWAFPATARLLAIRRSRQDTPNGSGNNSESPNAREIRLGILIPAHNEEHSIRETLRSIDLAVQEAISAHPNLKTHVFVGADGCSDRTTDVAREFGVNIVESPISKGKWAMLNTLAQVAHEMDWIVFVDCGAIWEKALLTRCLALCEEPNVIGVAPAYRNPAGGIFEKISWKIESTLKRMEDDAGGPVSVHGATVMYRRPELLAALEHLSGRSWLNDDVVIPFTLRILNPKARIRYASDATVYDSLVAVPSSEEKAPMREFGRRKRMVLGNIQWIRGILPEGVRKNPTVAYLALRRVFRLFWAWWGAIAAMPLVFLMARTAWQAINLGILTIAIVGITGAILVIAVAYRLRRPLTHLMDAALASLIAPFLFFGGLQTRWK